MVLAHVLRDLEQRMTEALKNMMNVCLLQRKEISLQTSKRRRSQNLFYVVYICKSPNKRVEVENTLHLLFYILRKEKAKKDVLKGDGRAFLFMMVSIYRYLFFVVIIKE